MSVTSPADIVTKIRSSQDSDTGSLKTDTDIDNIEEHTVSKVNDDDIETSETSGNSVENASATS